MGRCQPVAKSFLDLEIDSGGGRSESSHDESRRQASFPAGSDQVLMFSILIGLSVPVSP